MKKLLLIAFAALAFAACSDDDKTPTPPHVETITFSDAELGADGYLWGKTLASDEDGSLEFEGVIYKGEFYQFNLSSCIRQQNSLTAQFVSFSLSNLANIFYPPNFYNN